MKNNKKILILASLFLLTKFSLITFSIFIRDLTGSGVVATAQWNVSLDQSGVNNRLSVVSGRIDSTASYTLNIENNSEVDVVYSIVIDNLPSGITILLDNVESIGETNNKVIFGDVGTINASDTVTHTLTFRAESGSSFINNKEVDINVITRQTI